MIYLIDMDGVVADFERELLDQFRKLYPNKNYVSLDKRTTSTTEEQYPLEDRPLLRSITSSPGFFLNLKPIEGSLNALLELKSISGNEVFLCSSPTNIYKQCVQEKYMWVEQHLGHEWTQKIILTKDKTLVYGNYLIDDNSNIKGIKTPFWEHVIYDQPYNRNLEHLNGKKRISWQGNWREVLDIHQK